jgi:3-phenylpropionate/cinnamic acid dioxygenase small subunit
MSAEAELAVRNVLARLAQLADTGDVAAYTALMTDDVVWSLPANPAVGLEASQRTGPAEIAQGARDRIAAGVQGPDTQTMHIVTTMVVEFDGHDVARARSHFLFLANTTTTPSVRSAGRYDDELHRTAGGWKLARRTITFG